MDFWETVAASTIGFMLARFIGALIDSRITRSSKIVHQRKADEADIISVALEIRDIAVDYWATGRIPLKTEKMEAALQGRLFYLGVLIENLFDSHDILLNSVNQDLQKFDEAITRGDFKSAARTADLGRCCEIETLFYAFRHGVTSSCRKLPHPFWATA